MTFGGYFINDYLWILMAIMAILLVAIGGYFINGYSWLLD